MRKRTAEERQDKVVEDSFPASDPPASTGIVGPGIRRRGRTPAPHERGEETRPKGTPNHERHATETAYQWEDEERASERG